jgi:hypothetical protein
MTQQAAGEIAREADAVIASFGLPVTLNNLCAIAEEMERRLHLFPGGWVKAGRVMRELQRRALELAGERTGQAAPPF